MIPRRAVRGVLYGLAAFVLAAGVAIALGPSMGLFAGSRPDALGYTGGRFVPGDWRPNWVSSTIPPSQADHYVAPIAYSGDPGKAWRALEAVLLRMPRTKIVTRAPGYLHVEFASKGMGFVDDAEFALETAAGVIHVKSAARLGIRDFSVNRNRVESIRAALSAVRD